MKVLDRQVFDRGGPSHVRAFLHAVLFPSVRLLAVHPQQTRSRTLTVAVTHPGTNAHNCSLTSSSDHTTIFPLGHWYSSKSKWLDTYRYSNSQMPPCASQNETAHRVSQVDRVRVWVSLRQRQACLNRMSITCVELNWTKWISLRQAGLRRKYCNPTQGSCIDPIHEAHSDGHPSKY